MACPMANDPPFAMLNHFAADLGIAESQQSRGLVLYGSQEVCRAAVNHSRSRN
jgi:hypothetical protein